jgi:hypothetical protein
MPLTTGWPLPGHALLPGDRAAFPFAIQFLKSCDKTYGWQSLLQCIVADMIREGTDGEFPNGFPTVNGVVIGFMSVIGSAVAYSRVLEQVGTRDGQQGGQD